MHHYHQQDYLLDNNGNKIVNVAIGSAYSLIFLKSLFYTDRKPHHWKGQMCEFQTTALQSAQR